MKKIEEIKLEDLRTCIHCDDQFVDANFKRLNKRKNNGLCMLCYNESQRERYKEEDKEKYSIKNGKYRKSKRAEVIKGLKNCYNCNHYVGEDKCTKVRRYNKVGKTITASLLRAKKCYEGRNRK